MKRKNELITRRILNEELGKTKSELRRDIKRETGKIREEMHATAYRLDKKIDTRFFELSIKMNERFTTIDDVLKKHLDAVREVADAVIVKHNSFEQESSSVQYNYSHLEERVKKVEEVVFTQSA